MMRSETPLQVIIGLSLLSPAEESEKILNQAFVIDKLVNKLDQRWLESQKNQGFSTEALCV